MIGLYDVQLKWFTNPPKNTGIAIHEPYRLRDQMTQHQQQRSKLGDRFAFRQRRRFWTEWPGTALRAFSGNSDSEHQQGVFTRQSLPKQHEIFVFLNRDFAGDLIELQIDVPEPPTSSLPSPIRSPFRKSNRNRCRSCGMCMGLFVGIPRIGVLFTCTGSEFHFRPNTPSSNFQEIVRR